jgi:hypothetical protein
MLVFGKFRRHLCPFWIKTEIAKLFQKTFYNRFGRCCRFGGSHVKDLVTALKLFFVWHASVVIGDNQKQHGLCANCYNKLQFGES